MLYTSLNQIFTSGMLRRCTSSAFQGIIALSFVALGNGCSKAGDLKALKDSVKECLELGGTIDTATGECNIGGGGGSVITGPTATLSFTPSTISVPEGGSQTLTLSCSDGAGGTASFGVGNQSDTTGGAGANCDITGTNILRCRPRYEPGHSAWTATATIFCSVAPVAGGTHASTSATVTISVADTNQSPILNSFSAITIDNGSPASSINASDVDPTDGTGADLLADTDLDTDTLSYTCSYAVTGLDYDSGFSGPYSSNCSALAGSGLDLTTGSFASTGAITFDPPDVGSGISTYYFQITGSDGRPTPGTDSKVWPVTLRYPPTIGSITPTGGSISSVTQIAISGNGFEVTTAEAYLVPAVGAPTLCPEPSANTSTTIVCNAPGLSAGVYSIRVLNPTSNLSATLTNAFTYSATPTITSVSPAYGKASGGDVITITGTNFVRNAITPSLGSIPAIYDGSVYRNCTSYMVDVALSSITCTTYGGVAGSRAVRVTNPDGQTATSAGAFSYQNPPAITGVSPSSGPRNGTTSITISGTNLQNVTSVQIGPVGNQSTCGSPNASSSTITCITGAAPSNTPGTYDVIVTNNDGQSDTWTIAEGGFQYTTSSAPTPYFTTQPPPTVVAGVGFSPVIEIRDSTNTLVSSGSDQDSTATVSLSLTVANGATLAGTTFKSATGGIADFTGNGLLIQKAGTYTLTAQKGVTASSAATSVASNSFTVTPAALSLSASTFTIADSLVAVGSSTTLTVGLNDAFGNGVTSGISAVEVEQTNVGGTGTISTLTAQAAAGVYTGTFAALTDGAVDLRVRVDRGSGWEYVTQTRSLTVNTKPSISNVYKIATTQNYGPINSVLTLTITGQYFSTAIAPTVSLGAVGSCTVGAHTSTSITCTTPSVASSQTVSVVVTNSDGLQSGSSSFTFQSPPTINSLAASPAGIVPTSGSVCGGSIVVNGTNFRNTSALPTVTIGGYACPISGGSFSSTQFTCTYSTAAVLAAQTAALVVTNDDGQSATLTNAYQFTSQPATYLSFDSNPPPATLTAGGTFSTTVEIKTALNQVACVAPDKIAQVTLTRNVVSGSATLTDSGGICTGGSCVINSATAGVAAYTNLSLNKAGYYTLTAAKPDTSGVAGGSAALTATSSQIQVVAAGLSLVRSSVTADKTTVGNGRSVALTILLKDANDNPILDTSRTVTIAQTSGTGAINPASVVATADIANPGTYNGTVLGSTDGSVNLTVTVSGANGGTLCTAVGAVCSPISFTVVPLISFDAPSNKLPPITTAGTETAVQGTQSVFTVSNSNSNKDIDGNDLRYTCTFETPALVGTSDPNLQATASDCSNLNSYFVTDGAAGYLDGDSSYSNLSTYPVGYPDKNACGGTTNPVPTATANSPTKANFNPLTGSLTWNPRWDQRGLFKFTFTATGCTTAQLCNSTCTNANGSTTLSKSFYVVVREPWDATNLAGAFDGALSTGIVVGSDDFSTKAVAPASRWTPAALTDWTGLNGILGAFVSGSTGWNSATGAASTSSVSPYALNITGSSTNLDAMNLGSSLLTGAAKTYLSLWAKPTDTSLTNRVIASNRLETDSGTSSVVAGVTLRQSSTANKLQLVAEPISYVAEVTASRPCHWWRFEETSPSTLTTFANSGFTQTVGDECGSLAGTGVGSSTANQAGLLLNDSSKSAYTISLSAGHHISIPSSPYLNLNGLSGFTIEWVGSLTALNISKLNGTSTNAGWRFGYNPIGLGAGIQFQITNAVGATVTSTPLTNTNFNALTWTTNRNYLAVTYDGSTIKTYMNPTSASPGPQASLAYASGLFSTNTDTLKLGASTAGGQGAYYDELAFYTRALSAAEIRAHATAANTTSGCTATNTWTSNLWHHIAGVLTSTSLGLYINGRLECTQAITTLNLDSGAQLRLGNYPAAASPTSTNFRGEIGDLRIYNQGSGVTAATSATVGTDFLAGNRYREIPVPNIVADSSLVFFWDAANSSNGLARQSLVANGTVTTALNMNSVASGTTLMGTMSNFAQTCGTVGWQGPGTGCNTTEPYSLRFSSTNSNVTFAANSIPSGALSTLDSASFTIDSWVQLIAGAASARYIWSAGSSGCCGFGGIALAARNATYPLHLLIGFGAGGTKGIAVNASPASIMDGNWHHVAAVYNGATKRASIYVDGTIRTPIYQGSCTAGTLVGNEMDLTASCPGSGGSASGVPIYIGAILAASALNAPLSNVEVYNKALTAAEIRRNCLAFRHRMPASAGTCAAP